MRKPTEVTIKNMDQPQALAAFENGIGDFVALWAPHMYAGTDKGWKVAGSAALCGKGTPLVLVADTKYADAHPEITAKFLSVYLRGVEHLRTTSVDDLIPEYQRFFFDWAGKTYSKELARLDLESHPAWDIKGQLALFDTSKGMSTVQQWQADTAQFFASIGSITPDELKKVENGAYAGVRRRALLRHRQVPQARQVTVSCRKMPLPRPLPYPRGRGVFFLAKPVFPTVPAHSRGPHRDSARSPPHRAGVCVFQSQNILILFGSFCMINAS